MKSFDRYLTPSALRDDFEALADPSLSHKKDREKVNELVLNFVFKYLAEYCEAGSHNVRLTRSKIRMIVISGSSVAEKYREERRKMNGKEDFADHFPLRCLSDLRQTAAIFKEVAFGGRFSATEAFIGLDIGSGTGILTAAMALAAVRKKCGKILCVGIERVPRAAEQSKKVLSPILGDGNISIVPENVLTSGFLRKLFGERVPDYWVSETISASTPKIRLDARNLGLNPMLYRYRDLFQETTGDPFPEVLRQTIQELPDFKIRVMDGKTAMFPDAVNGLYVPDETRSTLCLRTGHDQHLPLFEAGKEFKDYEDLHFSHSRWDVVLQASERSALPADEEPFMFI